MRFVYVMDPMARVLPDKDTSFAFIRAARAREHESLHCLPRDLFVEGGDVFARVSLVTPKDEAPYYSLSAPFDVRIADTQAVFVRKDPPFDSDYLYATLLLEQVRGHTLVVNDPRGLREANEKLYTLHFPRQTPKTLVTADRARIFAFLAKVGGKAVIKPIAGAGGSGVMMLAEGDRNAHAIVDLHTAEGERLVLVQEYLPAVREGDKRILLLDGHILGAINRVPKHDELRSNIHVGGKVEPCEVTAEELTIIKAVQPRLRADGLMFVGLDVIGGRITEINVTSPTGIQELSRHVGRDVAADVIAWVELRASGQAGDAKSTPAP